MVTHPRPEPAQADDSDAIAPASNVVRLPTGPNLPRVAVDRTAELVAAARRGDLDAWSRLYIETFDAVLKHACYLTGDMAVAEDLAQEAFARAMTHIDRYDGRAPFLSWMRGIALNVVRMHWRHDRATDRVHDRLRTLADVTHGGVVEGPDRAHQQDRRMALLYQLLATLPENLREAFVLRDIEGVSPAEAAAQLGISEGNLAVRASRARARMRSELDRLGWNGGAP